jgi:hypothetical protein
MDQVPALDPSGPVLHVKTFDEGLADRGRDLPEPQKLQGPGMAGQVGDFIHNAERALSQDGLHPVLAIDNVSLLTIVPFRNGNMMRRSVRHYFWNL